MYCKISFSYFLEDAGVYRCCFFAGGDNHNCSIIYVNKGASGKIAYETYITFNVYISPYLSDKL